MYLSATKAYKKITVEKILKFFENNVLNFNNSMVSERERVKKIA